ncbi:DNA polymerase III subunit gamma/tau [Treponema pedis]|uniref:DNA polymerase III subunit gamma/tau n=1 Tax=Treponema pedis TaxID=409322 RepID=UPI002090B704|nr:DNA polymerase III subunit gamma/tau [Treponema pedis]
MEYQVTATRRRPQRFEDLLGQEFVAATLQKSIEAGKIAHAYLFSGPRGCGKTSSARILAKVLNCAEGPKSTPCGKCTSCEEITLGSCLDVIEIDGASNTSVNDVRQIKDEILFPPNSNRYKIYIIDEVHMLSTSAFNALLKTIEEPPPYVVFIFATTEIHKVPATIKSRCQQFNFKLVPIEILKEALAGAAAELNIQADDEALYWIAREATGSVRDAYTLFDQVAAFSDGHITFEKIHEKLGLTGIESINKLVSACTAKRGHEALVVLDEILQNGISVEQVVSDCADYFRSLLLVKHGITKEALIGQRAERFPQEILTGWNSVQIEQALSIMLQLFKDLRFSVDPRYELELAVSRLAWLTDYVSPQELKTAYDAARNLLASNAALPESGSGNIYSEKRSHTGNRRQNTDSPYLQNTNGVNLPDYGGSGYPNAGNGKYQNTGNSYLHGKGEDQSFSGAGSLTEQFKAILKNGSASNKPYGSDSVKHEEEKKTVETGLSNQAVRIEQNNTIKNDNANNRIENNPNKNILTGNSSQNKTVSSEELEEIKKRAAEILSKQYGLLASAVGQSREWTLKNENLFIIAKSAFDVSLLQKHSEILRNTVTELMGLNCKIVIKEFIPPEKNEKEPLPEEKKHPYKILMIEDIFMGKVVEKKAVDEGSSDIEETEFGGSSETVSEYVS